MGAAFLTVLVAGSSSFAKVIPCPASFQLGFKNILSLTFCRRYPFVCSIKLRDFYFTSGRSSICYKHDVIPEMFSPAPIPCQPVESSLFKWIHHLQRREYPKSPRFILAELFQEAVEATALKSSPAKIRVRRAMIFCIGRSPVSPGAASGLTRTNGCDMSLLHPGADRPHG